MPWHALGCHVICTCNFSFGMHFLRRKAHVEIWDREIVSVLLWDREVDVGNLDRYRQSNFLKKIKLLASNNPQLTILNPTKVYT